MVLFFGENLTLGSAYFNTSALLEAEQCEVNIVAHSFAKRYLTLHHKEFRVTLDHWLRKQEHEHCLSFETGKSFCIDALRDKVYRRSDNRQLAKGKFWL